MRTGSGDRAGPASDAGLRPVDPPRADPDFAAAGRAEPPEARTVVERLRVPEEVLDPRVAML